MSPRLHVLTACSRPENLGPVGDSVFAWPHPGVDLVWHVTHEEKPHVGGQFLKNKLLSQVSSGYVVFLDDDTTMHPNLVNRLTETFDTGVYDAVLYGRVEHGSVFPPRLEVGHIDIGQACLSRRLIGNHRIPETYDGDGHFLIDVVAEAKNAIYLSEPLSFYNRLRP